jgi:hypothetical protein
MGFGDIGFSVSPQALVDVYFRRFDIEPKPEPDWGEGIQVRWRRRADPRPAEPGIRPERGERKSARTHRARVRKAIDGREQPLSLRHGIDVGSMYVEAELPDITTPIFVEVQTPRGVWKTDNFSLAQSRVRAFRIRSEP